MSHTVGPTTTDYEWDLARGLPVVLDDGTNTYVYGLDLIASIDGAGVETYFTYDGLGSTADLTDDTATVTDTYSYDVFGDASHDSGSSDNDWLFTGEQEDGSEELYYLRARYYDSATGRFLSQDPLGIGNGYSYVGNNPVNYVDPSGLRFHRIIPLPPVPCISVVCSFLGSGGPGRQGNLAADIAALLTYSAANPQGTVGGLGIVNLVAGLTVASLSGCDDRREKEGGIVIYEGCTGGLASLISQALGGKTFTLGNFIFGPGDVRGDLLKHEVCHIPQYNDYGIWFLPIFLIYGFTDDINRLELQADDCAGTNFYSR